MSPPVDHGAQLRSMYAPQGGVQAIFSAKVADYVASRPDYPAALFDALAEHAGLRPGSVVADVGAGTGLLTRGLLERGCSVVAVEPNAAMRSASDQFLGAIATYRSVEGSAEALPLTDASVDLITAAQAFHWFEVDAARAEALRVLAPHGQVALIWNDRRSDDALHAALDEVFASFGGAKRAALVAHEERSNFSRFFGATAPREWRCEHEHDLDRAALVSLVFSRSYMPSRESAMGRDVERRVRSVFERFAARGKVPVRYTTFATIGRPAPALYATV